MSDKNSISNSKRILKLFKGISYLFVGIALVNLLLQVMSHISQGGSAVSTISILAQNIQFVVTSFFFVGFAEFIAIVRNKTDED
jgi:F0F1-type ATP synthase membrane subunit c/vacuolar-type H+-ATPase subunit K